MRSIFYGTALMCLLSGLLAFATAPALANTSDQLTQNKATATIGHRGPSANSGEKGFSSESKAEPTHRTQAKGIRGKESTKVSHRAKGGEATVARVNRFGKCLHVFSKPSVYSKETACISKGAKAHLNGVFSKNRRWAQLDNRGWVLFGNLKTNVKPFRIASRERSWGRPAGMGKGKSKKDRYSPEFHELNSGPIF